MSVTVSYPGVYVQELASGARAIAGVATSVTLFVGMAPKGRMNTPVQIFSFADFEREFGVKGGGELADQVRQFYLNGGGTAWVCRIANNPAQATVTLKDEQKRNCLTLTARDHGNEGNLIRAEVDYDTESPDRTFNLTVFKSRLKPDGTNTREVAETYKGVSMDPASGTYVNSVVNGASALITVAADQTNAPNGTGASISGRIFRSSDANANADIANEVKPTANAFCISVDNNPPVTCTFAAGADIATTLTNIKNAVEQQYSSKGITVTVKAEMLTPGNNAVTGGRLLKISSATGPVVISQAASNDISVALMLGVATGGIEGDEYGDIRPAQTGLASRNGTSADDFAALRSFAGRNRGQITGFSLADDSGDGPHGAVISLGTGRMYEVTGTTSSLTNVRAALDVIVTSMTGASTKNRWKVERHGLRIVLTPTYGGHNTGLVGVLKTTGTYDIGGANQPFATAANPANVAAYTVGKVGASGGSGPYQDGAGATPGSDGTRPLPADYATAYTKVERDVDLFNILVLPKVPGQTDDHQKALWGSASAFCAKKRAMLIIDPRSDWTTVAKAKAGADAIRTGVTTKNAVVYWPRIKVADGSATGKSISPSGAVAGLWARTDSNRGVWKAPAGLEATVRGVTGVERTMSDPENGVLNPKALNAIRVFPAGVVSWGARTLVGFDGSGNIDDKYVPVRRTMLFIEESLYRGLKFAIFEPNDEPLWAQIRLAAGSFMNGLFRQGAFAGTKAKDAYFVVCDSTTTTPNDINLGIVNVIVGFAPLKPAEFVVLTVTQIAGQVQV